MHPALWALAAAFFLFLGTDWATSVQVPATCVVQHDGNRYEHGETKQCPGLRSTIFEGTEPLVYRIGSWLDDHNGAVTGAATVFLTIITWRLVIVARDQSKTTRAQLRAYVFVYNGQVNIVTIGATKTLAYKLSIELRNFGQTPARKYTTWIDHAVRNVDDLPFTRPPTIDNRSGPTIMGPTASVTIEYATPFEIGELDAVRDAKKAIFIWGGCDYVDVFGCAHYFIFRFKISGHENQGAWRLRPHEIGEEGN
jgi:hypothetical protein